jgi:hypothetical protein
MRSSRREMRALLRVAATRPVPPLSLLDVVLDDTVAPASPDQIVRAVPSRRQLRVLLRVAGSRRTPELAPAFLAVGDARFGAPLPLAVVERRSRRERRRTPAVLTGAAAATVVLVVAGALTGIYGGPAAEADLALEDAANTIVMLPDGSTIDGVRGVTLPDGAIVLTGAHGRAAAGDVELGPGLEAVVDAGHLRLRSTFEQALAPSPVVPEAVETVVQSDAGSKGADRAASALAPVADAVGVAVSTAPPGTASPGSAPSGSVPAGSVRGLAGAGKVFRRR